MNKLTGTIIFICLFSSVALGQRKSFTDSSAVLNNLRIKTNDNGMVVLGSWGVANIVAGGIGLASARTTTWKSFWGMNMVWGVVNTGIAGMALMGDRKEMQQQLSASGMLHRYEDTKRLYLINAGLDVLYVGTGIFLSEHSHRAGLSHPETWRGFGRSITMQGLFLLVFDNTMFFQHQNADKRWYKLMSGVCFTGNGIGYNYTFN